MHGKRSRWSQLTSEQVRLRRSEENALDAVPLWAPAGCALRWPLGRTEDVPCGTDVMTPTYSCAIRTSTPSERPSHDPPSRKSQIRAARRRRQCPQGPAPGRVEAKRRALTTPSTVRTSKTRWCQARKLTCRMRRSSGKDCHASGPDLRADHELLCPGELRHDHVHAGGAFVRHVLSTHDGDMRHDQRWRERPRRGALGPPAGQDSGVVHAIVGSATATPAPVATAAQSAASRTRSPQVAPTEAFERASRSSSHQG